MAVQYNPSIVTNGLIYNFDPGNPRSYSGSGTGPVINLANVNYSFYSQLVGGVGHTFNGGGYFTFDGVDDHALIAGAPASTTNLTIDIWFYHTNTGSNIIHDIITINDARFGGDHLLALVYDGDEDNYNLFGQDVSDGTSQFLETVGEEKSGWNNLICSIELGKPFGGTVTYDSCFNGGFYFISPQSTSFNGTEFIADEISLGIYGYNFWNGRIGPVKIYNRALSRQEMLQNFNAHRGRYGV
jgi:hypothetical protein